jgi:hypothetical protein
MAEHEKVTHDKHNKNEEAAKKNRVRQKESRSSFEQSDTHNGSISSVNETPFYPRMEEHAATLSRIPFSIQRHEFIMRLNQAYGERYVQRLVESVRAQAKPTIQRQEEEEELQMQASELEKSKAINKENNTGMPDSLKTGIENLSGIAMDDVKVHYNSTKPAEVQALAYAQGSDIYVAPGQESSLPHEAWHVVQQKKGEVKTGARIGGYNVSIDPKLEEEADIMGVEASHFISVESRLPTASQSEQSRQLLGQPINTSQHNSFGVPVRQFICGFGKKATKELAESAPPEGIKIIEEEATAEDKANPREIGARIVAKLGLEPVQQKDISTYLKSSRDMEIIHRILPTIVYKPKAPITLYHGTLTENVDSILAQGLLPSKGGGGGANGLMTEPYNAKGYVYITTTPDDARAAARNFFPKGSITVLEVTLGTDILLVQDPDLASAVRTESTLTNVRKYQASR